MLETMKPMDIEKRSFEIITGLLEGRVLDPENELVVKRVIHTTADFDYADNLCFSEHAVTGGVEALRGGCDIVTDTQMAKAGINKTVLARLGGQVHCFMSDQDVAEEARERGVTRAAVSMERAAGLDPFEKADHMLSYVAQVTGAEVDGTVREKADGYAARLEGIESNIIPYYLAAYYLDGGRVEEGLEQARRYVTYVAANKETWERTFALLEEYEQGTREYRNGVLEVAGLLEEWNRANMGRIELDAGTQAFIARVRGEDGVE